MMTGEESWNNLEQSVPLPRRSLFQFNIVTLTEHISLLGMGLVRQPCDADVNPFPLCQSKPSAAARSTPALPAL